MKKDIIVYMDGGSLRNGAPDQHGYGSFVVEGIEDKIYNFQFGAYTNNQSEFKILLEVLNTFKHKITRINSITIFTDSQLVVGTFMNAWNIKSENLVSLRAEIISLIVNNYQRKGLSVVIKKATRDLIVAKVGH